MSGKHNMPKLDRRIRRTRRLLAEALISLALETDYDEISVKSVTQRADIGYATFYRHFKSKDELLMYLYRSALFDLKTKLAAVDSLRAEAEVVFEHARASRRIYRLYYRLPESNSVRQYIQAEFRDMLLERYEPREGANIPPEVALNHIELSASALIDWFLDNLDSYTPQEVTAMYTDLISRETTALSLIRRSEWSRQSVADATDCDYEKM